MKHLIQKIRNLEVITEYMELNYESIPFIHTDDEPFYILIEDKNSKDRFGINPISYIKFSINHQALLMINEPHNHPVYLEEEQIHMLD